MSIYQDFKQGLEEAPDAMLFVDSRHSFTYREVDRLTTKIAAGLAGLCPADEQRIAILSPNSAEAFLAMIGVIRAGAIFLPVNVRNTVQTNAAFLRKSECTTILFHSSLRDAVAEIRRACPLIRAALCIDLAAEQATGEDTMAQLIETWDGTVPPEPIEDPDRIALILATGGTSGEPKAAPMTNRGWRAYAQTGLACMPVGDRCCYLVAGPMTHGAGMTGLIFLSRGCKLVVLEKPDPISIFTAIGDHRVTHMFAPPTMIHMLLESPLLDATDLSSLASVLIAASPIAPDRLREAVRRIGPAVCQAFGQSEAPLFLTFLSNDDMTGASAFGSDRYASCGRSTPGMRVEIMADDGSLLPAREKGEIVARGDLVFPGYYRDPAATEAVSSFGWHHTGDIGYQDEDGFFYVVDRKRDMIVTGGFNIFSVQVEAVIQSHPAVRECVVVGVPDEKWGEAIKAVIELKDGHSVGEAEIQARVRETLGGVSTPKSVEFWSELPKSPNGKLLKRVVRERFWKGRERMIG